MISQKWSLIKEDFIKIGKGFLIALGGAACAYLASLSNIIDYSNFGVYAPYVALGVSTVCSTIINSIQKLMSKTTYSE
jgi:hypothetical protein